MSVHLYVADWCEVVASFYVYSTRENCSLRATSSTLVRHLITWRMSIPNYLHAYDFI